mmetsp:Transcript_3303/g.7456  ORF Transcript_3303/g.7456 Transcript_3303/m.7456 type:complete len:176 (-) Transcript_3303:406-933(-)
MEARAPLIGELVLLRDLITRPEINGARGKVLSFDEQSGRYVVRLQPGAEHIALRAANLQVACAGQQSFEMQSRVKVHGLMGRADLNGKCGLVAFWDEGKRRYGVQIDGVIAPILLRAANLEVEDLGKRQAKWEPEWRSREIEAHIEAEEKAYLEQLAKKDASMGSMFGNGIDQQH